MGKKGKGNKLAKMSEEERARYLQMRADIEEEARRRKIQLISLYMKNKIKREDAFCRLNLAKINQEWRSILRQLKCQDLRKEMLDVAKNFKEALERKDEIINRLLHDLDIAEDMYETMQNAHVENINLLIAIQQQRIRFLKDGYGKEKSIILKEYKEDFDDYKKQRDRGQEDLECVMYQLEAKGEREDDDSYEKHLNQLDDIKSTALFELEAITAKGEAKLERLWLEYQEVLSGYVRHTENFYSEYMDLKERDDENTSMIRASCQEIEKLTDQLATLKLRAADQEEKSAYQIDYLEGIRSDLNGKFLHMKQKVESEIQQDEEKFKLMSVESHNAIKNFKKLLKKLEIVFQLAKVCRKMETDREKMIPYNMPPLPRQVFESKEDILSTVPDELKEFSLSNWKEMEQFWRRVNNATVDVVCLKQRKKSLEDENAKLKVELQERLIELNLSSGSNLHINDYLAKRPSSMRVDRVSQLDLESKMSRKASSADATRARYMRPLTSVLEANFTSTVRSHFLNRGKPKLAKIETIVHWQNFQK